MQVRCSRPFVFVALALALLAGCGGPPDTNPQDAATPSDSGAPVDAGTDAGTPERDAGPPTCEELDCDDGIACTVDDCAGGVCMHEVQHEACGERSYCDALIGCVGGEACARSADCPPSPGGCFGPARCEPDTRTCTYPVLDGDLDGYGPLVCGGTDCDDANATVHPGAPEACNGLDEDCDGATDAPLAPDACRADQVCSTGVCGCGPSTTQCGTFCYDLMTDERNCGECGNRCTANAECVAGACVCQPPYADCGPAYRRECVLRDSDEEHCGVCGLACIPGAECVGGVCACPAGQTECADGCAPLGTTSDCLSCGDACAPGASCTATGCSPSFPWLIAYGVHQSVSWNGGGDGLAITSDGAIVHARQHHGQPLYEPGGSTPVVGSGAVFVSKHDASGARVWMHDWTGSAGVVDVEVGDDGSIYVLLSSRRTLTLHDGTNVSGRYYSNVLLVALDAAGAYRWHRGPTGNAYVESTGRDLDVTGSEVTIVGHSTDTLDFGGGALPGSSTPGFVAVFDTSGAHISSFRLPAVPTHVGRRTGALWVAGTFTGTASFGALTLTSVGSATDVFVAEMTNTGGVSRAFRFGLSVADSLSALAFLPGGDLLLSMTTAPLARLTPDGALVWYVSAVGVSAAPTSLAVDGAGRIWTAQHSYADGSSVRRYDASGALQLELPLGARSVRVEVRGLEVVLSGVWDDELQVGGFPPMTTYTGASGVWLSTVEAP